MVCFWWQTWYMLYFFGVESNTMMKAHTVFMVPNISYCYMFADDTLNSDGKFKQCFLNVHIRMLLRHSNNLWIELTSGSCLMTTAAQAVHTKFWARQFHTCLENFIQSACSTQIVIHNTHRYLFILQPFVNKLNPSHACFTSKTCGMLHALIHICHSNDSIWAIYANSGVAFNE